MKRIALILITLFFVVNSFSQTKSPVEVVNEFWNLALKSDFEAAKKLTDAKSFEGIKLEALKINFQAVSKKGFGKLKLLWQQTLPSTAKLIFRSEGAIEKALVEVFLVKTLTDWKIKSFDVKIAWNFRGYEYGYYRQSPNFTFIPNATPNAPHPSPNFQNSYPPQYSPFLNPAKPKEPRIIAESYSPQKDPVKFLEIVPKKTDF